jgi:hypothetical protein
LAPTEVSARETPSKAPEPTRFLALRFRTAGFRSTQRFQSKKPSPRCRARLICDVGQKMMISLRASFLLVLANVCVGTGCSTTAPRSPAAPSVAIAVIAATGVPPSVEQITRILEALRPELARVGFRVTEAREAADYLVTVSFTPSPGFNGGRVAVVGIEPSTQFRTATGASETPEAKEWRRRLGEIEEWTRRQALNTSGNQ